MKKPLFALVGPTCTGKTDWVVEHALEHRIAVVNVDSVQVYSGMDIGTAKPSVALREKIPHYLVDICPPNRAYSAADFCRDARSALAQIRESDSELPLLVGGSMFYLRALMEGLTPDVGADPQVRKRIQEMAESKGWAEVHLELSRHDPEAAARIDSNDKQRIARALEVLWVTGKSISEHHRNPLNVAFDEDIQVVGLMPESREHLHHSIQLRVEAMLNAGLVEEVSQLIAQYGYEPHLPAWRAVGYRQVAEHLESGSSIAALSETIAAATRQLAKRQMTWIRHWPGIKVVESKFSKNSMRPRSHTLDFIFETIEN